MTLVSSTGLKSWIRLRVVIFWWILSRPLCAFAEHQEAEVGDGCGEISLLNCNDIRVEGNLLLDFEEEAGGLKDKNGMGIGFTMVDPPSNPGNPFPDPRAPGYWADKLEVVNGALVVDSTPGLNHARQNRLDNALGIGLDVPSTIVTYRVTLKNFPFPNGGWAQMGLFFGATSNFGLGSLEDNFIKLVIYTKRSGIYRVQMAREENGARVDQYNMGLPGSLTEIVLEMTINAEARTVEAKIRKDRSTLENIYTMTDVPSFWFSVDQAGLDPTLATRSFGGIFASSRKSPTPFVATFDNFEVIENAAPPPEILPTVFNFDKWCFDLAKPTSLHWGPDDMLYATEIFGNLHRIQLDPFSEKVLVDEKFSIFSESRLTLGVTSDPASTPSNVILWVSHSSGSTNNGEENSSTVSRVSGPNLNQVEHVITGLPRAIANHGINSIDFGQDGKLYIAMGGNTAMGAKSNLNSEFGTRPEQYFSAAMLVADVNNPSFKGNCAMPVNDYSAKVPEDCHVELFATGLRNSYDQVFHSNGRLYATDNGVGANRALPPTAIPPCDGFSLAPQGNQPGPQPDLLLLIEQGKYYGHPNPYRDECIFKDGRAQGVAPDPDYTLPLLELGVHISANGIIEYMSETAFYGKLFGQLIISDYSVGDDLTRTKLSPDGRQVEEHVVLAAGFTNPLPLAQDPHGNIYVGELRPDKVCALKPKPLFPAPAGVWKSLPDAPQEVVDSAGAALSAHLYQIGGKTPAIHLSTVRRYDIMKSTWEVLPDLPGLPVENSVTVVHNGKLYVAGGSTAAFSGAQTSLAVFDPKISVWTSLAPMSTGRSGATAQVHDEKIYVFGGLDENGASLDTSEVYDINNDSWKAGPTMRTRRDNPGSALLSDRIYVIGGRIREASGEVLNPRLDTTEFLDLSRSPPTFVSMVVGRMNEGRRAFGVSTLAGKIQVFGGESPVVASTEEYDPVSNTWRQLTSMIRPRHGMAIAMWGGKVYAIGGGTEDGGSYSTFVDVFEY